MRVLVIDDEPQIRRALTVGLRSQGHNVTPAANGAGGLEILAAGGVDVVIL